MRKRLRQTCLVFCLVSICACVLAAPVEKDIKVVFNQIRIFLDGNPVRVVDDNGQSVEPFIYNGAVYVPAATMAELVNRPSMWDGATSSYNIGSTPDHSAMEHLTSLEYARVDSKDRLRIDKWGSNPFKLFGKEYYRGIAFDMYRKDECYIVYNLNSLYCRLTGIFGCDDSERDYPDDWNQLLILGDDRELLRTPKMIPGNTPFDIDIDVTGINQIVFRFISPEGRHPVLADPVLYY